MLLRFPIASNRCRRPFCNSIVDWDRSERPAIRRYPPAANPAVYVRMRRQMRVVEKRQLLSAEEISRTLQRLAHEIVEKSGGTKDLALIGVRRRGVPLSERLAKTVKDFSGVDIPVGTIDITLYRDDLSTVGPQPVVHSNETSFSEGDRGRVIVDDVLYPPRPPTRRPLEIKQFQRGRSGPGERGRRAFHRPPHSRRHERSLRSRPPQT